MSKRKRLTRKEKIEKYGELKTEENVSNEIVPVDPEELYISEKSIVNKITIYKEEDAWRDDFKPSSKYYFIYCTGHHIYVKTRDRMKAQEICDKISGQKGFYRINTVIKAIAR